MMGFLLGVAGCNVEGRRESNEVKPQQVETCLIKRRSERKIRSTDRRKNQARKYSKPGGKKGSPCQQFQNGWGMFGGDEKLTDS